MRWRAHAVSGAWEDASAVAVNRRVHQGELSVPLKVGEIIKLILMGGVLDRTRGSHRQYRHEVKPGTVTIAGKPSDTLHPRTEGSILRQAKIERWPR